VFSDKEEYKVHHKVAQCYLKLKHFSRARGNCDAICTVGYILSSTLSELGWCNASSSMCISRDLRKA
jgi:hypothetical protein